MLNSQLSIKNVYMDLFTISKIALFKSLSQNELGDILSDLKITESKFKKGDILALQDEACNRLIILLSGKVKAEMSSPSGKIMKVEDIEAPNPLAILFLFGDDNRFPVEVTALEDITALVISKQSVLKMLGTSEVILKNYLDISANYASKLSKKLNFMSLRSIRQKLAMYILNLSKLQQSNIIELDKSKTAIAEYFGISRPSLERELTKMQDEGFIQSSRKTIEIRGKDKLIQLVNL